MPTTVDIKNLAELPRWDLFECPLSTASYVLKLHFSYLPVKRSTIAFPNSSAAAGPLAVTMFPSITIGSAL